jgi:uncharacterized protein YecE (DUF72 family)
MIRIGNCGWSYLDCGAYFEDWEERFDSKLQVYAKLFGLVEINSTFYNIPKLSTAEKWRREADAISKRFEFTLKVSQIITHRDRFSTDLSIRAFGRMKELAEALRARILVFQSPDSFRPTPENMKRVKKFFGKIDRGDLVLVWEVRWQDSWTKEVVSSMFPEIKVNQCVDPLRQECFHAKDIAYYRLHGFGQPSMYSYTFSDSELQNLAGKIRMEKRPVYVLFNNGSCYGDALRFAGMMK